MTAGENYDPNHPELIADRAAAHSKLCRINSARDIDYSPEYRELVRSLLPNAHETLFVRPPFYIDYGYNVFGGEGSYFNFDCVILDIAEVRIGRNCFFAPKVQLLTATHPIQAAPRSAGIEYGKPITIGDECWFGGGVIVLPGVTIGDRCVVGAGSVVTRDLPADSVAVGNPARVIRHIDQKTK